MHINELSRILNQYFNFHKARSDGSVAKNFISEQELPYLLDFAF